MSQQMSQSMESMNNTECSKNTQQNTDKKSQDFRTNAIQEQYWFQTYDVRIEKKFAHNTQINIIIDMIPEFGCRQNGKNSNCKVGKKVKNIHDGIGLCRTDMKVYFLSGKHRRNIYEKDHTEYFTWIKYAQQKKKGCQFFQDTFFKVNNYKCNNDCIGQKVQGWGDKYG